MIVAIIGNVSPAPPVACLGAAAQPKREGFWRASRHAVGLCASLGALSACSVTSPHWGYVPESTEAPIPVQAWTAYTANPVVVECATATSAHGWPMPDESAYISAASLAVSASGNLDGKGSVMHTASGNVAFPSQCWDYFGDYDFWQLNLRVSQIVPAIGGGTMKRVFSSFDLVGLECLGSANGAAASWFGFIGQGCEKTYLGTTEQIPYIVLRIDGYAAGLARATARSFVSSPRKKLDSERVRADVLQKGAPKLTPIVPLTLDEVEQLEKAAAEAH